MNKWAKVAIWSSIVAAIAIGGMWAWGIQEHRTAAKAVATLLVAVSMVVGVAAGIAKGGPGGRLPAWGYGRYPLWGYAGLLPLALGVFLLLYLAATG